MFFKNKTNKLQNFVAITDHALNVLNSLFNHLEKTNNDIEDFIVCEQYAVDLHNANMISAQMQIMKNRNIMSTINNFVYEDK